MAWGGFKWLRTLLALLHIVAKETDTKVDDRIADIGDRVVDVAETLDEEE